MFSVVVFVDLIPSPALMVTKQEVTECANKPLFLKTSD